MTRLVLALCIIVLLPNVLLADTGAVVWCPDENQATWFANHKTSKIYCACSVVPGEEILNIIDPETLLIESSYPLDGSLRGIHPMDSGYEILVLMCELDGDTSTTEGRLQKLDLNTGFYDNGIYFDNWSEAMVVDSNEQYAYVSAGLEFPADLIKISLDSYQQVAMIERKALECNELVITPDDSKIYLNNSYYSYTNFGEDKVWYVDVYQTSDFSRIEILPVGYRSVDLDMGANGYLYIGCPLSRSDNLTFQVIDTSDDSLVYEHSYILPDNLLLWWGNLDESGQYIYYTTWDLVMDGQEVLDYQPGNSIMRINTSDWSNEIFDLGSGDERFWSCNVLTVNGQDRIFCREFHSINFWYMDLPVN